MLKVTVEYNERMFFGLLKSSKKVRETVIPYSVGQGPTVNTIIVKLSEKGPKIQVPISLKQYWRASQDLLDIGGKALNLTAKGAQEIDELYAKHRNQRLREGDLFLGQRTARGGGYMR